MNSETLWVPFSVLNGTTHSANTRLIWLLLGRQPSGTTSSLTDIHLRGWSGLDPRSIAAARTRLIQAPLAPCYARPCRSCAAMPWGLLTSAKMSVGARLLYGQFQGVPDFQCESGSFTYAALSHLTGSCDDALRRAVAELVTTGWLTITQANRKRPLHFTLRNPVEVKLRARISRIRRRVRSAKPRGETLLREFLNVTVALKENEDNASPDQLINPYTGELLELDRYYPKVSVAFEFNGAQHYEETELATFAETVKQVGRDAMKAFICKALGIELVIIHPEDLSLRSIEQKIPGHLPRCSLEGMEPLVDALEELAAEYRERTAEERARNGRRSGKGQ